MTLIYKRIKTVYSIECVVEVTVNYQKMESGHIFNVILMVLLSGGHVDNTNAKTMSHNYSQVYGIEKELSEDDFYSPLRGVAAQLHYLRHLAPEPLEDQDEEVENPSFISNTGYEAISAHQWNKWDNKPETSVSASTADNMVSPEESFEEQDEDTESVPNEGKLH